MRLSRQATYGWGVVQLSVALGAQWMRQSVLDAGLSVLSLTTGPGPGCVPGRRADASRRIARDARRHGRRGGHDGHGLVDRRPGLDLVGAGRRATTSVVALLLALLPAFRDEPR